VCVVSARPLAPEVDEAELFAPVLRDVDHSRCVADFQAVLAQVQDWPRIRFPHPTRPSCRHFRPFVSLHFSNPLFFVPAASSMMLTVSTLLWFMGFTVCLYSVWLCCAPQFVDVKTQLAQQISFTTQLLAEKESNVSWLWIGTQVFLCRSLAPTQRGRTSFCIALRVPPVLRMQHVLVLDGLCVCSVIVGVCMG
jgi:hypothetical protein